MFHGALSLATLSWAQEGVPFMLVGLAFCWRDFGTHFHPLNFPETGREVQRGAVTCPSSHKAELRKLIWVFAPSLARPWALTPTGLMRLLTTKGYWAFRDRENGGQSREVGLLDTRYGNAGLSFRA